MQFDTSSLIPVLPEIFILTAACVVLVVDLFLKEEQRVISYGMTQISLLLAIVITLMTAPAETRIVFDGSVVRDGMSDILKIAIFIISGGAFLYSKEYLRDRDLFKGEYYVLGLFAILGMMVMVSANSFLTVYLGLELLALSFYALVAFNRDSADASEAAMKYFVLGALASGMLLYGISMIYGATGSIGFQAISEGLANPDVNKIVLVFGLVFVVIGLAFKFGAVPFHMWVPDVYHGAPTAVTVFIGSAPKLAAFAFIMRLLVQGLGAEQLLAEWQDMLILMAALSLAIGNVTAIAQTNLKRMLAYSTIGHMGFLLLGILSGDVVGYGAGMFYVVVYMLMNLGAFGMILLLSRAGFEAENLDDFKGLNQRSPWYAFLMLLLMFSMAGVPPTVGFYAKLSVLQAVISVGAGWSIPLAVFAVLFSLVGAYYYLRLVKLMYFDAPVDTAPIAPRMDVRVLLSLNGLFMLVFGIFPERLMWLCSYSIQVSL